MKKILFLSLIFICGLEASDVSTHKKENEFLEKIYLSPESVLVSEKQIYVQLPEGFVPVEHMHSDYHGIYVFEQELQSGRRFSCLRCNSIRSIEEGCCSS